ncbi:AGAP012296-PA-like protein [Anopheles sinensis]|uniref:AGAP012296-PA-like protein n=1 Tax=Anopheles sinensis TaxID=74873 RepID=A0A084WHV4_ANOSI|nr:AGAP012296-PA-like protein [Anopheles sinensis]
MEIDLVYLVPFLAMLYIVYHYITKDNNYFHDKPIPSLVAQPLFGSTLQLVRKKMSLHEFMIAIYNKYPLVKVFGMHDLTTPVFVVRDPELIKRIGVKDFEYFINHRPIFGSSDNNNSHSLFDRTLFGLKDQKWRDMRATLSPAFTGSKMRQMFELVGECCESMVKFYKDEVRTKGGSQEYEMKDVFTRFANDVIATCAFGIKVDSLRNAENDFYENGIQMSKFQRPNTVRTRKANGIVRHDMVHLLMQARKGVLKHQKETKEEEEMKGFATVEESEVGRVQVSKGTEMSELEMVAQCVIFFIAGFDAVSTCLTFLVHELTVNREVQDKLYEEIRHTTESLAGSPLTYDAVQKMQYLDMVVSESLRMWSPNPSTDRLCVRDYVLDDGESLKFTIDKDTVVFFPIAGLHHDPKYFPNPGKFDPERFSPENRDKIHPGTYLPFGIGPRNCIGSRFALMEVKAIIYYMLKEFTLEKTPNTQVPLQLGKGFAGMRSEKGVFVELRPRKE